MLTIDFKAIIEIISVVAVLALLIAIESFLLIRSLKKSYKEVYRYQSKFDIELRKIVNLLSKVLDDQEINYYLGFVIKDLSFDEKKELIHVIDHKMLLVNPEDPEQKYILETYENLHSVRRNRDSMVIVYNRKIKVFPYNFYAKIMNLKKWRIYSE